MSKLKYCKLYNLSCSKEDDIIKILEFTDKENEQHNFFDGYLSLKSKGCKNNTNNFLVLYNEINDELAGVCLYKILTNSIYIEFLTSRALKDKDNYIGIGTFIINYLKELMYKLKLEYIFLVPDYKSTGFYKKLNFKNKLGKWGLFFDNENINKK